MAEEFRVLRPREYHSQLVAKGRRADGRSLEDTRQIKLETDAIRTADSSSLVKLGNTSLVCGCTIQLVQMQDGIEDTEEVKIKVELPPICSSPTTGYRTNQTAQLLTRALKSIIVDSNCIDRKTFHIPGSDKYWIVEVEVVCLNYDGSLLDAALLAVMAALKTLRLVDVSGTIPERTIDLQVIPTCNSFALLGDRIIVDPNLEEENVSQSTFSITIDTDSQNILNINKTGGKALSAEDLLKCINIAKRRSKEFRAMIDSLSSTSTRMDCI